MWTPVNTKFYVPQLPVSIVSVSGGGQEFTRATLEALNCVVLLHSVGTPSDFLQVIAQGQNAPRYMIIIGHGTQDGLDFGEYGPSDIDTSMLHNGAMPPEVIRQHVNLPGCTVFSYSCEGGSQTMAEAFLSGGLAAYIGCRAGPDVAAMNLFLFHFLHGVTAKKLADRDAWHRAIAATDHPDINEFSFFHSGGAEERFLVP